MMMGTAKETSRLAVDLIPTPLPWSRPAARARIEIISGWARAMAPPRTAATRSSAKKMPPSSGVTVTHSTPPVTAPMRSQVAEKRRTRGATEMAPANPTREPAASRTPIKVPVNSMPSR